MKSKVLICALVVLLVIGMVSCSMDEYAKLGDFMGKMGNNVYGIEPSMKEVDSTTAKINDSVKKDESGNVTIDTTNAGDLISGLAEIKNSTQKTNAMKEELSKKVTEDAAEAEAVKTAMQKEIENVVKDMPASSTLPSGIDPAVKDAYESVNEALKKIQDKVSDTEEPTKADLATVAIVKSLAETVTEVAKKEDVTKEELIEKADDALQALDALKVAADAAGLGDILGDISISSLLSSAIASPAPHSIGRSVAKAADDSELDATTRLLVQAAEKLVTLVCNDDGSVNAKKYNRVLFQLSAIRTAYEASASFVMPKGVSYSDGFGYVDTAFYNGSIGLGRFSANDAVLYTIAFAFTEADSLFKNDGFFNFLDSFLTAYASENEEEIKKVEKDFEDAMKGLEIKADALAKRSAVGVNTLCAILADAKYIDTVKDTVGRDTSLGESLNDLFNNIKGESK